MLEDSNKDIFEKDSEIHQQAHALIEPIPGSSGLKNAVEIDVGLELISMEETIQRTPRKKVVLDKSNSHTNEPKPGTSGLRTSCFEEDLEPSQACAFTDPIPSPSGLQSGAGLNGEPVQINVEELIQNNP